MNNPTERRSPNHLAVANLIGDRIAAMNFENAGIWHLVASPEAVKLAQEKIKQQQKGKGKGE